MWYKQSFGPPSIKHRLYPQTVPNIKVSFKSDLQAALLQTVGNSFKDLYNLNRGINSKQAIVNKLKTETRNYFSPLYFAKTGTVTLPLSFSFNKLDFFRNNGEFGRLIKNEQNLLDSFEMVSLRMLRKRVSSLDPSSRLTGAPSANAFPDQTVKLVNRNHQVLNLFGSSDLVTILSSDPTIYNVTYGLYTYTVEMTFVDNTHLKLSSMVNHPTIGLQKRSVDLAALYKECIMPNNCEGVGISLTDSFASIYSSTSRKQLVLDSIQTYVSAISLFHKNLSTAVNADPGHLALKIYNLVDPLINGPKGLSELIKLLADLSGEVNFYATRASKPSTGVNSHLRVGKNRLSADRRLLTVSHTFKEGVDADNLRNDGYQYLTTSPDGDPFVAYNPFRYISYSALSQLTEVEKLKFPVFNQDPLTPISLTPNIFNLRGALIEVNSPLPTAKEKNALVVTTLLAANKYKNSPVDFSQFNITDNTTDVSTTTLSVLNNNLHVMSKESCTVSIISDSKESSLFSRYPSPPPRETSDYLDVAEIVSEESPLVQNRGGGTSLTNFMMATINNNTAGQYYNKIKNINNHVLTYLVQTDYFAVPDRRTNSPVKNITDKNVFKSRDQTVSTFRTDFIKSNNKNISKGAAQINQLLLKETPPTIPNPQQTNYINDIDQSPSGSDITEMAIKYGNIRNIEYLAGFTKVNDSLLMKNPLWLSLTNGQFTSFNSSQKVLLCRLREVQSTLSEYGGVTAPLYNEYFILGPSQYTPPIASQGSPIFQQIPITSFATLNLAVNLDPDVLKYAISINDNIKANNPDHSIRSPILTMNNEIQTENLYTNGGDFLLPNGDKYIGSYHLYYDKNIKKFVAMEGTKHAGTPHARLAPVSARAARIVANGGASQDGPQTGAPGMPNGY